MNVWMKKISKGFLIAIICLLFAGLPLYTMADDDSSDDSSEDTSTEITNCECDSTMIATLLETYTVTDDSSSDDDSSDDTTTVTTTLNTCTCPNGDPGLEPPGTPVSSTAGTRSIREVLGN